MSLRKLLLPFLSSAIRPWSLQPYQRNHSIICSSMHRSDNTRFNSTMADEYGQLDSHGETYEAGAFKLESGEVLESAQLRYSTFGKLNENKDNVLVVCHALTGNSRLDQWWGSLLGPGLPFDTSKYYVICTNILGSCYGSTGPTSINPATGKPYGIHFPKVTIRDAVKLQLQLLQNHMNITSIKSVIGGSMGGMQALEMTILGSEGVSSTSPPYIKSSIIIGCGAKHTAWQIGISETQRQAIYADENWQNGEFSSTKPPSKGLALARKMAMISYRSPISYEEKFGREIDSNSGLFQVQSYLRYQGRKFLDRFDALTYVKLTEIMDTHDVGRNRGDMVSALQLIRCPTLVLGINSDLLYPIREQEELAKNIPHATFGVIDSINGHDGFLLEQDQVGRYIYEFLEQPR